MERCLAEGMIQLQKKWLSFFFSVLCLLGLANCATDRGHARTDLSDIGVWQGKVMSINPSTNYRQVANVSWVSDSSRQRMRVDVYALFDIPIATFLKDGDSHHLWLFTEKKHYMSQDGRKLFQHLTKLPVDPKVFFQLLGPMQVAQVLGPSWSCVQKEGQHQCESREQSTWLSVENQQVDERKIKIVRGEKTLQIRISRSKVEFDQSVFKTLATSQFKTIRI